MQTGRILFPDRSAAHPLHRGRVKINRSSLVHCDVIGVIENLSDGQWNVLTKDMQDMTRLEFVKTCLGLISYLSKSTFKRYLPVVEILESCKLHTDDSYDSQKSPEAPVSPQASSPLDTPYNHYILAQIVEEVKLALFVAIKRITSTKDSTQSSKGMMLEEETVKAIYERLDTLNILANVNNHEEVVLDSEARAMTVQVVISVLNLIESSNLNKKQAGEISKVLHEIAAKIKILASPKTSKQNLSFGSPSISCPLKGELYLQLSPDFPVKVSQTVLAMLLRGKNNSEALEDRTCHSNSLPSTTPKHRPDLSYIVTVDSIVFKIVITILASIALIPGFNDEIIFSSAMDMFHKILNEVEQFMTLSKTSVRKNKTDIASLQPSQHSLEDDVTTMCTKKVILQIYHAYLSNRSKVEQHKTAPGRESEVSVVDHVMIQLNTLADTRSSTQQPFQSNLDGSNESTKKVISPDFQSMAHRKLLFPSCPSKVIDPEDFIQRTPSSNLCMAKAVHESCSGDSTCSSHDAKSIPAVGLSTQYVENPSVKDVACSTSSLGLIIGLHTDSANKLRKPKRKVKTEVKICIKPKIRTLRINNKYLSKKNAVSPMLFEAYARASKLQENYMQKGTTGLHNERHPTSSSQTEKNSTVPTLLEGQGIFQICLQRGV
ncbi:hypothetical protein AALO_G00065650 [Alosa alosa]|uniref:Uncharacterized protein n=1 Tax=Alosa alosa TaxID=278164 RepID=A0AAV6H4J8_9TELE|nr:hypothetical protein AALO_G00065650 [Alosa alosa]